MITRSVLTTAFLLISAASGIAQTEPAPTSIVAAFSSSQSNVPQPDARKLTLATAIDAAEANYPKIRAAMEHRNSAQAGIGIARSAYYPRADILWQTNRATANNIYGLLLPQGIVPSISGPVIASDYTRSVE